MSDIKRGTGRSTARPGERLARERGTVIKDWGGRLPVAVIYPNSYYVGMSNLGVHTVYSLLNSYRQVVAERVFWERENRGRRLPAASVESGRPLTDFSVLAFSVTYELDYFHITRILSASGIPLNAADRDERYPLVIAGGPCITANPMPLTPFFDCLCIGEAEPILPVLVPALLEGMSGQRDELLKALSALPGIYAPRHQHGTPVVRQWAKNLSNYPVASAIVTPDTELGDLYLLEVERGCNWGCRFCLVHTAFSPMRCHPVNQLIEQARQGLAWRKRVGLVGPAVTDHPDIEQLLVRLRELGAGLSISSMRIKPFSQQVLEELARGGIRTITLAPEAGSERLRRVIKKGVSEDDILQVVDRIAEQGIRRLKLYFIIGLPTETDEDIDEIIRLLLKAKDIADRRKSGTRIIVTISPFVPKANTPFQWLPMAPTTTVNNRLAMLKKSLPARGIQVRSESTAWSQVQGILSRGDSSLAKVLATIEDISLNGWCRAIAQSRLDIDDYVSRSWDIDRKLPWGIIDSGINWRHLAGELDRALG